MNATISNPVVRAAGLRIHGGKHAVLSQPVQLDAPLRKLGLHQIEADNLTTTTRALEIKPLVVPIWGKHCELSFLRQRHCFQPCFRVSETPEFCGIFLCSEFSVLCPQRSETNPAKLNRGFYPTTE